MVKPQYASDFPRNHTVRDYTDPDSGLRVLVRVGTASFCGYVGVHSEHAIAGLEELDFDCHQGITFSSWGSADSGFPEHWYWWGLDYAHYNDVLELPGFDLPPGAPDELRAMQNKLMDLLGDTGFGGLPRKRWTAEEVFQDGLDVLTSLKERLAQSRLYSSLLSSSL